MVLVDSHVSVGEFGVGLAVPLPGGGAGGAGRALGAKPGLREFRNTIYSRTILIENEKFHFVLW